MHDEQYIRDLLKDYLKGRISAQEAAAVESYLKAYPEFEAELDFERNLLEGLVELELEDAHFFLTDLEKKLSLSSNTKESSLSEKIQEGVQYSINQLQRWFAPVQNYEKLLQQTAFRAVSFKVLQPRNSIECSGLQLSFRLNKPVDNLLLLIEDNEFNELIEQEFEEAVDVFQISLSPTDFHPGRYYWKLSDDNQTIVGVFFIQKNLMS